jgi:hypothetical protein
MIVVDASVLVTALADDGDDGDHVRERLRAERLATPHLIDLEVVSAWRRLAAAGRLDVRRVALAMTDLGALSDRPGASRATSATLLGAPREPHGLRRCLHRTCRGHRGCAADG